MNCASTASRYIEVDKLAIPTGRFTEVAGTPLDFKTGRKIGSDWENTANLIGEGMYASRIFFPPDFICPLICVELRMQRIQWWMGTRSRPSGYTSRFAQGEYLWNPVSRRSRFNIALD